jgi:beta-glucosidase
LSYTNFSYNDIKTTADIATPKKIKASARVSNTGKMDGEEVVQLYVAAANEKQLVRSLKGFKRIFLKAGESKTVEFTLTPDDLSTLDANGKPVPLSGKITISIGGGQPDVTVKTSSGVVKKDLLVAKK